MTQKAVVLLSGGIDSAVSMAIAQSEGFDLYAISFRYGQRHEFELQRAKQLAAKFGVADYIVIDMDLRTFGGSALTGEIAVPTDRSLEEMSAGVPVTYVPARNTIFLSFALSWAEVLGAEDIFIGVNVLDYAGYPDCRAEYIAAFERMADLATKAGVEGHQHLKIHTPLINLTKTQIIEKGLALGVDFVLTSSCYAPTMDGTACGRCDACQLRRQGFAELGVVDPIRYASP